MDPLGVKFEKVDVDKALKEEKKRKKKEKKRLKKVRVHISSLETPCFTSSYSFTFPDLALGALCKTSCRQRLLTSSQPWSHIVGLSLQVLPQEKKEKRKESAQDNTADSSSGLPSNSVHCKSQKRQRGTA